MRKEPNRQNYKRINQHNIGWWEVKMVVLLLFVVTMVMVGAGMQQSFKLQATSLKLRDDYMRIWKWNVPLEQRLGVTFKEPWQMSEADLTAGRLVYNLLTKPGFRLLAGQLFLGILAVGAISNGLWWLSKWQWRQLQSVSRMVNTMSQATIRIEIAGTVNIVAENGVIYASVPDEAGSGEDRYGFYLATVKISIVHEGE
jgi:high-affinity Fe2+/Pb2+ permease